MGVALTQGLTAARANVDQAWAFDVVNTSDLRQRANERLDLDAIAQRAVDAWKADLLAKYVPDNPWLGKSGQAALLGAAAAGISGARKAAENLGAKAEVREAREDLSARVRGAMDELVAAYTGVVNEIDVGDAASLRLRATEFLHR